MMPTEDEAKLFDEMMTHKEEVFRICLGFSRNASDAEDLAQDVYLKAYQNLGRIHSPYAVKDWLWRVARNVGLDHQKRRRVVRMLQVRASDPVPSPGPQDSQDTAETQERLRALKLAIGRLPWKLREVFVLREYGELSYQEVARTLGIKEGTVMSRLSRARAAVTKSVKEACHG